MPDYDYRVRFHLSQNTRINFEDEEHVIFEDEDGKKIRIRSGGIGSPIMNFSDAAIIGGPYTTPEHAREAAEQVKAALLVWAVRERVGIDLGDGHLRGGLFAPGIKMFEEMYKRPIRNDIHGVDVYEHKDNMMFVRLALTASLGKDSATFKSKFIESINRGIRLTEKQLLASELFCASYFDVSFRSRLITLVTAIEAMLDPVERPNTDKYVVADMENIVRNSSLSTETKDSMMGSLQWLKYESIQQAGRKHVSRFLGDGEYAEMSAQRFFNHCYGLRSQILHTGKPEVESIDLSNVTNILQIFVSNLLVTSFGLPVV